MHWYISRISRGYDWVLSFVILTYVAVVLLRIVPGSLACVFRHGKLLGLGEFSHLACDRYDCSDLFLIGRRIVNGPARVEEGLVVGLDIVSSCGVSQATQSYACLPSAIIRSYT